MSKTHGNTIRCVSTTWAISALSKCAKLWNSYILPTNILLRLWVTEYTRYTVCHLLLNKYCYCYCHFTNTEVTPGFQCQPMFNGRIVRSNEHCKADDTLADQSFTAHSFTPVQPQSQAHWTNVICAQKHKHIKRLTKWIGHLWQSLLAGKARI